MNEDHYLTPFLEEKLPQLGLDAETYGNYLCGLLPAADGYPLLGEEGNNGADEEEWNGVLELLRASSETHSDDDKVWNELKEEILQKYAEYQEEQKRKKEKEEIKRQEAMKIPVVPIPEGEEAIKERAKKNTAIDDQAKKDLLARFAYEDDEDDHENNGDAPAPVIDNKAAAQQANIEKARELRKQSATTKKEEQMKTKQERLEKQKLKEERRKRTQKGERKR